MIEQKEIQKREELIEKNNRKLKEWEVIRRKLKLNQRIDL